MFELVLYFASTASDPLRQPMSSYGDLKKEIVSKPLHVYTKHSKNVASTSLHAVPSSFCFFCLLLFHFLLLRWILLLLQTWTFLLLI